MIRELSIKDSDDIYEIINKAAGVYKGHIPADCYHEPYMLKEELDHEMKVMIFFGWEENNRLVGVMGFQPVRDVTLIRHAYVLPECQGKGGGTSLLNYLRQKTKTNLLLVGTWVDATWAVGFYKKQGFELMPDKDALLKKYWKVPQRQIETSVVLSMAV